VGSAIISQKIFLKCLKGPYSQYFSLRAVQRHINAAKPFCLEKWNEWKCIDL